MLGMIDKLTAILNRWQIGLPNAAVSRLLNRMLGVLVLLLLVQCLPIAGAVWGVNHFVILHHPANWFEAPAMLLSFDFFREHYAFVYGAALVIALATMLGYSRFWLRLLLWFLFLNLSHGNPELSNAGWAILKQCLFFATFLFDVRDGENGRTHSLKRLLHNLSFYAIWFQIALLYFVAGANKLLGYEWLNGNALAVVLSIEEYSIPLVFENLHTNTLFLKIMTWVTLAYQLAFMPLIWFRRLHGVLLPIGMLFHLGIIVLLGIADFGIVMLGLYVAFVPNARAATVGQRLGSRFFNRMAGMSSINGKGD